MEWITLFEKIIWFGFASVGFAILFNVPVRTLLPIFLMGGIGGFTKVLLMAFDVNIVLSSLCGAIVVGLLSISFAHIKHSPPPIFAIPSVIPMVPGMLAYRMMLGLIKLSGDVPVDDYTKVLAETINNGLKVMFILMSLAVGVAVPMLITRKDSVKHLHIIKRNK